MTETSTERVKKIFFSDLTTIGETVPIITSSIRFLVIYHISRCIHCYRYIYAKSLYQLIYWSSYGSIYQSSPY